MISLSCPKIGAVGNNPRHGSSSHVDGLPGILLAGHSLLARRLRTSETGILVPIRFFEMCEDVMLRLVNFQAPWLVHVDKPGRYGAIRSMGMPLLEPCKSQVVVLITAEATAMAKSLELA